MGLGGEVGSIDLMGLQSYISHHAHKTAEGTCTFSILIRKNQNSKGS